jgi:hypothetical protein
LIPQSRKKSKKAVKKLSKNYQNIGNIGQKAQLAKVPQSLHSDFLSRFLLHKKGLKSFLHSLTICDKVASGNNNNKKVVKKLSKFSNRLIPQRRKKVKKLSKSWQPRTKSSVSKTPTMSAPQKNVTCCHSYIKKDSDKKLS